MLTSRPRSMCQCHRRSPGNTSLIQSSDSAGPAGSSTRIQTKRSETHRAAFGPGATSHCSHGPGHLMAFREFIDWRPFAYFTSRMKTTAVGGLPRSLIETVEFVPLGDHRTRIIVRYRATNRSRISLLGLRVTHAFLTALWQRRGSDLVSIADEDVAALRLGGKGNPQTA